jgi:predicted peroxiredoxin
VADKTLINLATGLEDAERVLVGFLVGVAALEAGRPTAMFLTKDAVRLACDGCPPLERLFEQFAENGGELLTCPICLNSRGLEGAELVGNARVAGATPLWEWIGNDTATVFSY